MKKEYIDWNTFDWFCDDIIRKIKNDKFKPEVILAIPNGGLPFATVLANKLKIKVETSISEVERKYICVLVVDDVADTGNTLLENFPKTGGTVKMATLCYKPQSKVIPDYYAYTTTKWIIFPWGDK